MGERSRGPLPLPDAFDAVRAVLDERFDSIDRQFAAGQREFRSLHQGISDTKAEVADVKAEILTNRSETARLTSQVQTQNGNVAEALRRIGALEEERKKEKTEDSYRDRLLRYAFEVSKFVTGGAFLYTLHLVGVF